MTVTASPRSARPLALLVAALLVLALPACTVGPQEIHYGSETCDHCHMVISEPRFAAQAVTTTGMAHKFDSIECMADFLENDGVDSEALHSLWVADFSEPHDWTPVEDAAFLRSDALQSPMGLSLSAHADRASAEAHREELGGELLNWDEVRALVAREGLQMGGGHAHH